MSDETSPGVSHATEDRGQTAVYSADYADDPPEGVRFWVEDALADADLKSDGLQTWVPSEEFASSSLVRLPQFPSTIDGTDCRELTLSAVRNEKQSAQLAVTTTERVSNLTCSVSQLAGETDVIPADGVTTRFVGYVPVDVPSVKRRGQQR